jgi:hypothetical protein
MTIARHWRGMLAAAGVAGAVGYAVLAMVAAPAAAGGWLIAYLFWSGISIGSITALMIHRLTGGRWGDLHGEALWAAAGGIVVIALMFIPVLALLPAFYPWAGGPSAAAPDVRDYYLNGVYFVARSVVAFVGWTVIVFVLARRNGPAAVLVAAVGLVFQGFIIGFVGLDWIQSISPPFFSTSFGASLAVTQLMSALAWAAVSAPARRDEEASCDLGGLLLATVLGLAYLDFMTYLIVWYGDLPHKNGFFVSRETTPWLHIAGGAFALMIVVPTFALFLSRIRNNASAMRAVGGIVLAGVALQYAWLAGPAYGPWSLLAAALAAIVMGALLILLNRGPWRQILLRPTRSIHVE